MSDKTKVYRPHARRSARRTESGAAMLLRAAVIAFAGGAGVCLLLLALFALLLTYAPVPLTLVRPLACAAAAAGAFVSAWVFAARVRRQRFLCGLGCGVFYAVCQMTAAWAVNGSLPAGSDAMMLPLALLCSGVAGGALAAVRAGA